MMHLLPYEVRSHFLELSELNTLHSVMIPYTPGPMVFVGSCQGKLATLVMLFVSFMSIINSDYYNMLSSQRIKHCH